MEQYIIEMNYTASITQVVEANDEGEALDKARNLADEADINEFVLRDEQEARIISRRPIEH